MNSFSFRDEFVLHNVNNCRNWIQGWIYIACSPLIYGFAFRSATPQATAIAPPGKIDYMQDKQKRANSMCIYFTCKDVPLFGLWDLHKKVSSPVFQYLYICSSITAISSYILEFRESINVTTMNHHIDKKSLSKKYIQKKWVHFLTHFYIINLPLQFRLPHLLSVQL